LPQGATLEIFNRWGEMVYHSVNYGNDWGGKDVDSGVYYYLISLPNKERKRGFVEVVK